MRKELFKIRLLSLAALCGIAIALASCSSEENVQGGNTEPEAGEDKGLTTFVTGTEPESRTSMDYTTGAFFWEADDYIYVQDDDNVWRKSSNAPTGKTAYFRFKVPGKFSSKTSYEVYYPGKGGINDQVTIPAAQTQKAPNTTAHLGESGDCGIATANKVAGKPQFEFKLDHQASYLVFQPYTNNTILKDCYLTKVEVTSDNDITATYTLDPTTGELKDGTATGKQIVLTTKGTGIHTNGFPMNTTAASVATNGAYMVIKPGIHTLQVRYWLKDVATNIEGTITKNLSSFNYAKNTYYDMTASLDVRNYTTPYYMWDAQLPYWYGYEWTRKLPAGIGQPTSNGMGGSNFPRQGDWRYYHQYHSGYVPSGPPYPPGYSPNGEATYSCRIAPNANEMLWYVLKGDPRWDGNELWTTMEHLCKGGMWFKKKAYIRDFNTEISPYGYDYRGSQSGNLTLYPTAPPPSASEVNQYFYLPALGIYTTGGYLNALAQEGLYWSSSSSKTPWLLACYLRFFRGFVRTGYDGSDCTTDGLSVCAFE